MLCHAMPRRAAPAPSVESRPKYVTYVPLVQSSFPIVHSNPVAPVDRFALTGGHPCTTNRSTYSVGPTSSSSPPSRSGNGGGRGAVPDIVGIASLDRRRSIPSSQSQWREQQTPEDRRRSPSSGAEEQPLTDTTCSFFLFSSGGDELRYGCNRRRSGKSTPRDEASSTRSSRRSDRGLASRLYLAGTVPTGESRV